MQKEKGNFMVMVRNMQGTRAPRVDQSKRFVISDLHWSWRIMGMESIIGRLYEDVFG
jgi:hypothetical protein